MAYPKLFLFYLFTALFFSLNPTSTNAAGVSRWQLLQKAIGISAMHMQLLHNDRVVIFDRTDFGLSNISLPNGNCRTETSGVTPKPDCTAHSVEYDVLSNSVRALMVLTDTWCSSGAVLPNGSLVQTGGYSTGQRRVRIFNACATCDWTEIVNGMGANRWYATNHILPDSRVIVIGGVTQNNYEFHPKTLQPNIYNLPFLSQTYDAGIQNNLYPFVFLNVDGNLFIYSNNRAILLDYFKNVVVKTYPTMPGGHPRNYPSTGSAVLLPLRDLHDPAIEAEVLVCGGAPNGSYAQAVKGTFAAALNTCGRIKITDTNPQWVMETMPHARVMGDMTLLPNGDVLLINGAGSGTAGWEFGRNPVYSPDLYMPNNQLGSRFQTQTASTIPRMYHSNAVLLRDGRLLVGGSNPHQYDTFTGILFPTDMSLEAFYPSYLDAQFSSIRPKIIAPVSQVKITYNQSFKVRITVSGRFVANATYITMVMPSFTTHSFSMNQRLLVLGNEGVKILGNSMYEIPVTAPTSGNVAPSGYYMLFAVHQDIPSEGIWVSLV